MSNFKENRYDVKRLLSNNQLLSVAHELSDNSCNYKTILQKHIYTYTTMEGSEEQKKDYIKYVNVLYQGLEKGSDWTIAQIIDLTNEMKYRKASKPNVMFKSLSTIPEEFGIPNDCFEFGKPACVTEKMDGAQICIDILSYKEQFTITSHSGGQISPSNANGITVSDLDPKARDGHTTLRDHTFQGGNLTKNLQQLIPVLQKFVKDFNINHAKFYFELTFGVGQKTPKQIVNYDSKMNMCYLFCAVFNLYENRENIPSHVVKISVNPDTQPIFSKYGIPTVPILYHTDSFSLEDWKRILDLIVINFNIEGGVFCQQGCYQKLVINYQSEEYKTYEIPYRFQEYFEFQRALSDAISRKHVFDSKIKKEKSEKPRKKFILNTYMVDEEYNKEMSHADWKDELTQFYSISNDNKTAVYEFMFQSELVKKIIASLKESDEFKTLNKQEWTTVRFYIKELFIKNKKVNKETFNISTSSK
jgi:hypothetical protein